MYQENMNECAKRDAMERNKKETGIAYDLIPCSVVELTNCSS